MWIVVLALVFVFSFAACGGNGDETVEDALGGAVIVESIFNWPGLGYILLNALMHRDYLVVQAIVVWMAFVFLLVNLLADLISQIMNPKMKES